MMEELPSLMAWRSSGAASSNEGSEQAECELVRVNRGGVLPKKANCRHNWAQSQCQSGRNSVCFGCPRPKGRVLLPLSLSLSLVPADLSKSKTSLSWPTHAHCPALNSHCSSIASARPSSLSFSLTHIHSTRPSFAFAFLPTLLFAISIASELPTTPSIHTLKRSGHALAAATKPR